MRRVHQLILSICLSLLVMVSAANAINLKVENRQQAIELVKKRYPDKVLKVQSVNIGGSKGYQVKLLSSKGVIFYLIVDAQTGNVRKK